MRISIRRNGNYLIDFDQLQINGRKAIGGYALTLVFIGNRHSSDIPLVISDISLSISTSMPEKSITPSVPCSTLYIQCFTYPNTENLFFEIVLTKAQINALEEYRQEGDLKLKVGLRAMTLSNDQILSSFDCSEVTIARQQWLNALKSSGYRQTILFEVPLPKIPDQLMTLIAKAQEFIEIGHYKDAVMQCRLIVEQVESIRGDKKLSSSANAKAHCEERKEMTVIERMLSLREQLKNICQLGAHGSEDFTRSQAKAVLGMTLSLLAEPTVGFADVYETEENQEGQK